MSRGTLWGSALAAAAGLAGLTAAALPLLAAVPLRSGAVRLLGLSELWLLAVFTEGILALLLGLSALAGWWLGASGVGDTLARRGKPAKEPVEDGDGGTGDRPRPRGSRGRRNGAAWVTLVGAWLLLIYGGGWWVLSRPD